AIFHYKQSTYYDRARQFTILWNDPRLNVQWPVANPILSNRDSGKEATQTAVTLKERKWRGGLR
ncbi:MAG: dTDP-4-dehydrorhamnose 3,5-epimerase family protein, partial [Chloroflexi bacterium]|nr:dTDP-4-dehydrorhamnose 3,5-epimerase family protein [Chloroflexota bacterium]